MSGSSPTNLISSFSPQSTVFKYPRETRVYIVYIVLRVSQRWSGKYTKFYIMMANRLLCDISGKRVSRSTDEEIFSEFRCRCFHLDLRSGSDEAMVGCIPDLHDNPVRSMFEGSLGPMYLTSICALAVCGPTVLLVVTSLSLSPLYKRHHKAVAGT